MYYPRNKHGKEMRGIQVTNVTVASSPRSHAILLARSLLRIAWCFEVPEGCANGTLIICSVAIGCKKRELNATKIRNARKERGKRDEGK